MNIPEPAVQLLARIKEVSMTHVLWFSVLGVVLLLSFVAFVWLIQPPKAFPVNTPVTIEPGLSASGIADMLAERRVVRSTDMLYLAIVLLHDPSSVKAGSYVFREPYNVFEVARLITDDNPPTRHLTITFYEGTSAAHYAILADRYLPEFNAQYFLDHTHEFEGYLFPDTYYLPYTYTAPELIDLMLQTYRKTISPLMATNTTGLSEYEVLTLASLLEREANSKESMRMVAGILMNRLEAGMPLQVDASMEYVIDRPLNELTPDDLKTESPYNTYLNVGLPPTPIGNPGVSAVEAALDPMESDYFFYITGTDGNFYYAETYDKHLRNIELYL
ncbi:MAG: endolytic transglycosylase MltG [Candidatus Paceibacterota bacterium]